MFRGASWRVLLATALMFFAVGVAFLAFDLRPQSAVAMASALLMGFLAGYTHRAWVVEQDTPPRLGSLWLKDDSWSSESEHPSTGDA